MVRYEINILNSKVFGRKEIPFTVEVNVGKPDGNLHVDDLAAGPRFPAAVIPGGLAVRISCRDFPPAPAAVCASEGAP